MNRRQFFKRIGLATGGAAAAAVVAAVGLPALPKVKKPITSIVHDFSPWPQWRKIWGGTDWEKYRGAVLDILEETNEVLQDMKWVEGDKYK